AHFDTAAMKPRSAEADVPEGPVLTRACVVDCEVSVLKPQLFQVMAIEARFADPIDPGQKCGKDVACSVRRSRMHIGRLRGARSGWWPSRRQPLPGRVLLLPRRPQQRGCGGNRYCGSRDRMLIGAGKNRNAAILLDPHGHFGANEIETLGPHMAAQQTKTGD